MPCKKSKFATKEAADNWRKILSKKRGGKEGGSSYFCLECVAYHVTKIVSIEQKTINLQKIEIDGLNKKVREQKELILELRRSKGIEQDLAQKKTIKHQAARIRDLKITVGNLAMKIYQLKPDIELDVLKGYSDEKYKTETKS